MNKRNRHKREIYFLKEYSFLEMRIRKNVLHFMPEKRIYDIRGGNDVLSL